MAAADAAVVHSWADYEEGEPLGRGSYGAVVRVTRRGRDQLHALKRIDAGQPLEDAVAAIRGDLERLMRLPSQWLPTHAWDDAQFCPIVKARAAQLRAAQRLPRALPDGHCASAPDRRAPSQVLGIFATPFTGVLMELGGISLVDALQLPAERALGDAARVRIALDVASAVRFLHACGVAQLDLKPGNVLVDAAAGFRAKVAEYGASHLVAQLHGAQPRRGTLVYMAPEVHLARIDAAAAVEVEDGTKLDVFAYGLLLCELWSGGASPLAAMPRQYEDEELDMLLQICRNRWRPVVPAGMPAAFAAVMQRCWRAAPEARPSFEAICEELAAAPLPAPLPSPASEGAAAVDVAEARPAADAGVRTQEERPDDSALLALLAAVHVRDAAD
jgi:serine/threonine protein kinase